MGWFSNSRLKNFSWAILILVKIVSFCSAQTGNGDVVVVVTAAPDDVVPENTQVTLSCSAYNTTTSAGIAVDSYTWTRTGQSVSDQQSYVVTSAVTGYVNLTCTIANGQGGSAAGEMAVYFYDASQSLYAYGTDAGDSVLEIQTDADWKWYDDYISDTITFITGAPFGSTVHKVAHVLPNGAITFGSNAKAWWPDPQTEDDEDDLYILGVFWHDINPYRNGKVYYQLYEKPGANGQTISASANYQTILDKAKSEISTTLGVSGFEPTAALVVTWEDVQPYQWWWWICSYYDTYKDLAWWVNYAETYTQYCSESATVETNTFQAVYVTDGFKGYAIVIYKSGSMNWVFDPERAIEIGYSSPNYTRDFGVSYTDVTTVLDTQTFNTGRYGTWIEEVGTVDSNYDAICTHWYENNLYLVNNSTFQNYLAELYNCPCSLGRLGPQWTQFQWDEVDEGSYRACYVLGRKDGDPKIQNNPYNKMCCYLYEEPEPWTQQAWREALNNAPFIGSYKDLFAGHILTFNPYPSEGYARESESEDFSPKEWCCEKSTKPSQFCALYEAVRPVTQCSNQLDWSLGRAMGDPHFRTLDGVDYIFNGKGEYILMEVTQRNFMLQARTDQAENVNGVTIDATVVVAVAIQDGTTTNFQVKLNEGKTGMTIMANGNDITYNFYEDDDYYLMEDDMEVVRHDRNETIVLIASFTSNVGIEVYVGKKNLEITIKVTSELKGRLQGLLGNYNDDASDEFILPDGTVLTTDQTNTERKIYESFGTQWTVTTSSSAFTYEAGMTTLDYQYSDFVPIFIEEVNQTLVDEAISVCGSAGEVACVYDYVATQDMNFALMTKSSNEDLMLETQLLTNNLPVLTLATRLNAQNRWNVSDGVEATLQFSATDADGDNVTITFMLAENVTGASIDSSTGVLTYTPDATDPQRIGVLASDSIGLSEPLYIDIVVCTGCSEHGQCDFSMSQSPEYLAGTFILAVCNCIPAWKGEKCDEEFDACGDLPCGPDISCTDIGAEEQGVSEDGFTCGECVEGYELLGSSCIDTNECIQNGTDPVCINSTSTCLNSIGSYECLCLTGYREDDENQCNDIDECAEKLHDCEQVCVNTMGSFNCSCTGGDNLLNGDGKTCQPDPACTLACEGYCYLQDEANQMCACNSGYETNPSNSLACEDLDECSGVSPCGQECTNTVGSFNCSCYTGYKLQADGVSCEECDPNYYGDNCGSRCQCNGNGVCDNVRGCVCVDGWSGTDCITDVDECEMDTACPVGQVCMNTLGSFSCSCATGYLLFNDTCEDTDECINILLYNCDLTVEECSNTQGSYSCVCLEGYARNASNICADIDECTLGSHDCEQLCENVDGSYTCMCEQGYALDNDRVSCTLESDPCMNVTSVNCSHICTVDATSGVAVCSCPSGYGLVGTEQCEDMDECEYDYLNLCEYKLGCGNTDGGYNCTCELGSYLDNDGRSCINCSSATWGENCASDCECDVDGASSCDPKYGCVCRSGFSGTHCETDIDECTAGTLICGVAQQCVNTRGSAECQCIDGYVDTFGTCTDLDECASAADNDCQQTCNNFAGGYSCSCYSGYKIGNDNTTCEDIDECDGGISQCEEGQCVNTDGAFRCTCPEGLELAADGYTCEVSVECSPSNDCTDKCAVTAGVETCYCNAGRELNNKGNCIAIVWCADNPCSDTCNSTADNTYFVCSCPDGKFLQDDGLTCADCLEGTYGAGCAETCTCNAATTDTCDKTSGACNCQSGWEGENCAGDIDECDPDVCVGTTDSTCENTPGSYICKCNPGFYLSEGTCTACGDFTYGEECSQTCDCEQQYSEGCNSTTGSCECKSGWSGTRCNEDIDECANVGNECVAANKTNWVCSNLPGSFECKCEDGYQDVSDECQDVDECAASYTNECNHNCINTVGDYTCSCNAGYSLASNMRTCVDDDECTSGANQCSEVCTNTEGSYTCSCNPGRELINGTFNCYASLAVVTQLTFYGLSAVGLNLRDTAGDDYQYLLGIVKPALESEISSRVTGFKNVTIHGMSAGSVIVDYTAYFDVDTNPDAASNFVDMLVDAASAGMTVNGSVSRLQIVIGSLTVDSTTDKCLIMEGINGCPDSNCYIDSTGAAVCGTEGDDDDIPLIVGLCVGIPLGLALIAAIIIALWYKKKYKGQKRVNSRIGQYNGSDGSPSTDGLRRHET